MHMSRSCRLYSTFQKLISETVLLLIIDEELKKAITVSLIVYLIPLKALNGFEVLQ